MNVIIVLSQ